VLKFNTKTRVKKKSKGSKVFRRSTHIKKNPPGPLQLEPVKFGQKWASEIKGKKKKSNAASPCPRQIFGNRSVSRGNRS